MQSMFYLLILFWGIALLMLVSLKFVCLKNCSRFVNFRYLNVSILFPFIIYFSFRQWSSLHQILSKIVIAALFITIIFVFSFVDFKKNKLASLAFRYQIAYCVTMGFIAISIVIICFFTEAIR